MDEHSIGLSAFDFFSLKSVFCIVDRMTIVKFKSDYVVPNSTPACDSSFITFKLKYKPNSMVLPGPSSSHTSHAPGTLAHLPLS